MPCRKPSLEQDGNLGPDAARARNRRSLSAARCAGCGAVGKTLESSELKVPALHREAERDTTGSFSRQPPVHTWNGGRVQGTRRRAATLRLIRRGSLKLRLTLRFYCGNRRLPGGKGFVGEPRKSSCFTGMRASVRCSIAVFRRHSGQRRTGPVIHPDNCLEFSHCCCRPPGR